MGDRVYTADPVTSLAKLTAVERVIDLVVSEVLALEIGDETIRCTPNHRFYLDRWIPAKRLESGDVVRCSDGHVQRVRDRRRVPGSHRVFNLALSGAETFFVGSQRMLVNAVKEEDGIQPSTPQDAAVPQPAVRESLAA